MEEEDNIIVKWAQEDVETSYNLLNNNNFCWDKEVFWLLILGVKNLSDVHCSQHLKEQIASHNMSRVRTDVEDEEL